MARVIRKGEARVTPLAIAPPGEDATRNLAVRRADAARVSDERLRELTIEAQQIARAELAAAHLEVERARQTILEEAEASIATLALAVARRLVADDLEARPERVRAIVLEALDRVRRATRARVRVHPSDAAQLLDLQALDGHAEVVADPSIERGGCLVESELGEVDARLEVRLDALARALANARKT
jgi:flagellar biosynthesis/type III secretory pathway protein FliH